MRIGFDVDGVLAEFTKAYEEVFVRQTGRNTFEPYAPTVGPKSWDWPTDLYGYTAAETSAVWAEIRASETFNSKLPPLPDMEILANWLWDGNTNRHDMYFITSRPGPHAKLSTENWLIGQGVRRPTVLIVKGELKGDVAKALNLEFFVEDNMDNAATVGDKGIPTYLITRAYNAKFDGPYTRIASIGEILTPSLAQANSI